MLIEIEGDRFGMSVHRDLETLQCALSLTPGHAAKTMEGFARHFLGTKIPTGSTSITLAIVKSSVLSAEPDKSSDGRNDNPAAFGLQGDRKQNVKYHFMVELIMLNIVLVFFDEALMICIKLRTNSRAAVSRHEPASPGRR